MKPLEQLDLPKRPRFSHRDRNLDGTLKDEAYKLAKKYASALRRISEEVYHSVPVKNNPALQRFSRFWKSLDYGDQLSMQEQFQAEDFFSKRDFHTGRF